jgi:hypothetical protein
MSTHWTLEAPSVIGNNIVNMIDTRSSDGLVAVATCGHGVLTGNFEPRSSVTEGRTRPTLSLECVRNPVVSSASFVVSATEPCDAVLRIVDQLGAPVIASQRLKLAATPLNIDLDLHTLASGSYFCELSMGDKSIVRQLVIAK